MRNISDSFRMRQDKTIMGFCAQNQGIGDGIVGMNPTKKENKYAREDKFIFYPSSRGGTCEC